MKPCLFKFAKSDAHMYKIHFHKSGHNVTSYITSYLTASWLMYVIGYYNKLYHFITQVNLKEFPEKILKA